MVPNWFSGSVWKRGHIDDVIERAAGRIQRGCQIFEGEANLAFEIGFGRSIFAAADLSGHEQEIAGSDGGGIAMRFVKAMSVGGKDCFALGHDVLTSLDVEISERRFTAPYIWYTVRI